jgi:hypothetical protein
MHATIHLRPGVIFLFFFFWGGVERDLSRFLFLDSSSGFLSSFEAD